MKIIALIGYRQAALTTAKEMGLDVIIWSNKPLPISAKKQALAYYIDDFPKTIDKPLSDDIITFFSKFETISAFIALTEASVIPTALLRQYFDKPVNLTAINACHNKLLMKQLAIKNDIPVTDFALLNSTNSIETYIKNWGFPIYAKPLNSSGSRNLHIIKDPKELTELIGKEYLIEKAIDGTEFSIEFFIQNKQIIFINVTEYYKTLEINIVPAPKSLVSFAEVNQLISKVVKAYDIDDTIVHLEAFKTAGGLLLGEFAIRPPGGYLMEAIKNVYQFNPWQVLFDIRLGNKPQVNSQATHYVAFWIMHPGSGEIKQILGLQELEQLSSFVSIKLKKQVGDFIEARQGLGQDVAKLFFRSQDYKHLVNDIEIARKVFKIILH